MSENVSNSAVFTATDLTVGYERRREGRKREAVRAASVTGCESGEGAAAVVSGINIKIERGQTVCLIGPNGSGKTTALRTVTGQLRELGGSMTICGRPLAGMSEKERAKYISVVLTERISPELMTCRDIVSMGRYPYTGRMGLLREDDRAKVDEAIAMVNASDIADRQLTQTSDGQRQRIMLARAICQEAALIVLDEPTSFLDIRYKLEILTVLKRLARERGTGVLMSVHELELARAVADYVICFKNGRVFAEGAPDDIFKDELISELYDLDMKSYDECFKNVNIM